MSKRGVLIIEDDRDIVEMLECHLQEAGYETVSALNGEDGIAMARKQRPDLIILDIMLPIIDGFEVCRTLKKDDAVAHIPIKESRRVLTLPSNRSMLAAATKSISGDVEMDRRIEKRTNYGLIAVLALAVALTMLPGCTRSDDQAEGQSSYITVKGSDTMVHLVSNWAEVFMKQHSGLEVSVTGGGSGTGIAAILNGTTDICAASRQIKDKEQELALQKNIHPKEIAVARDGIAVVVHPDNPVTELTVQQLGDIFTGRSRRWSDVGGSDGEILVLSRESSSGTYVFFQEMVLKKQDYMQEAKLLPATSAIIQSASTDKTAIGYVGLGYALAAKDQVKIVAVKADDKSPAVLPSDDTVKSGQYPIARALYLYLNGDPQGTVKKFIDFCLSTEGQAVVTEAGYVAVK